MMDQRHSNVVLASHRLVLSCLLLEWSHLEQLGQCRPKKLTDLFLKHVYKGSFGKVLSRSSKYCKFWHFVHVTAQKYCRFWYSKEVLREHQPTQNLSQPIFRERANPANARKDQPSFRQTILHTSKLKSGSNFPRNGRGLRSVIFSHITPFCKQKNPQKKTRMQ